MRRAALLLCLALPACTPEPIEVQSPDTPANRFLDGTPGETRATLLASGYEYVGGAMIRTDPICEPQLVSRFGAGFAMLRNPTTGEKALCCTVAANRSQHDRAICKPVPADFAIGPDSFSGKMLQ